jgi:putative transposase
MAGSATAGAPQRWHLEHHIHEAGLDQFSANAMALVKWPWSGHHGRVVKGISLTILLRTDGDRHIPRDYRIYEQDADGKSQHDPCRDLLREVSGAPWF